MCLAEFRDSTADKITNILHTVYYTDFSTNLELIVILVIHEVSLQECRDDCLDIECLEVGVSLACTNKDNWLASDVSHRESCSNLVCKEQYRIL